MRIVARKFSIGIAVVMVALCICSTVCMKNEKEILYARAEEIVNQEVSTIQDINEDGTISTEVSGLSALQNRLKSECKSLSDLDIAKIIYRTTGEPEQNLQTMDDEQILEALKFVSSTETVQFVQCDETGNQQFLTKEELLNGLLENSHRLTNEGKEFLQQNGIDLSVLPKNNQALLSDDGVYESTTFVDYMKFSSRAARENGVVSGRVYYTVNCNAMWLSSPNELKQDVFAITSNATYDDTYNNFGSFSETCLEYVGDSCIGETNIFNTISKVEGTNAPNDIWLEYSAGVAGIALRFDMYQGTYIGDTAHRFVYSTIISYLRYRVSLFNADANIQCAYGHKKWGVNGISVGLMPLSISFSIFGVMDKLYSEPLPIYYIPEES